MNDMQCQNLCIGISLGGGDMLVPLGRVGIVCGVYESRLLKFWGLYQVCVPKERIRLFGIFVF